MIDERTIKKLTVIGIIIILITLSFIVVWPIIISVILGLLMGYIFYPLYSLILKFVRERNISALIVVLLLIFVIFIPIWFLFPLIARQAFEAYSYFQKIDLFAPLRTILPDTISKDALAIFSGFSSKIINSLFSKFSDTLLNLPDILLKTVVTLFVFFFSMRDAEKLKDYIRKISPFSQELEKSLSKQFQGITNSVVYGHILVGLVQGILAGIGFFIFQVPQALLLSIVVILAAILPLVGAWLVWVPAAIYMFTTGHTGLAVGLFLYGAILVSWIDNFLRPYIIARKTNLNSGIILIGMIGGLFVFGILGILLGPLIIAYLLIILDAYKNKELAKFFN